jgi:DNA-binding MarR family transcriptional regulator
MKATEKSGVSSHTRRYYVKTASQVVSLQVCATEVMEAVPDIMETLRSAARSYLVDQASLPQLRCLGVIDRNPGLGISAVAQRLGVATPTTSAMVDRLVRAGSVQACADPADRRRSQLFVTSSGLAQLQAARGTAKQEVSNALSNCSAQELQIIYAGLSLLKQKIKSGTSL